MPESLAVSLPAHAAFERLVDYAGLFPPAQLPLADAVAEYERARRSAAAWMLGRFVVPVALIATLESALGDGEAVAATVLVDGETPVRSSERVRAEACEIALRLGSFEIGTMRTAVRAIHSTMERLAPGLPLAVELPSGLSSALVAEATDALAESGCIAKLRCGGATAQAVPPIEEVAHFVRAASHAGIAFKATAGLHHPIRHENEAAGFTMHGFLNVLAAACAAPDADTATVREIVADEDASSFTLDDRGLTWRGTVLASVSRLADVRRHRFLSVGSCSFVEPVEDLVALGFLRE